MERGVGKVAKERAGAILRGETDEPRPAKPNHRRKKSEATQGERVSRQPESTDPEPLKCRFHDLRHSAGTRLLEAGALPRSRECYGLVSRDGDPQGEALWPHRTIVAGCDGSAWEQRD
jgi:integrase